VAKSEFSHTSMGNLIEVSNPENPGLPGNRNSTTLQNAFPQSPTNESNVNDRIKQRFDKLVMQGPVSNGFGFSLFNREFVDAPDIESVEKDNNGNDLVSPFAPNVASPNEQATAQENEVPPVKGSGSPFRGNNLANPKRTSENIAKFTLGSLGLGTSAQRE
jgi:hypothetical protein